MLWDWDQKNMVLFEVNSTPATPLEKSQPLVSFNHEWGEKTLFSDSWFTEITPLYLTINKNGLETPSLISLDVLPY